MRLLFLQEWLPDGVLKAIGWTLIHSLWQGLLAAVLAGAVIISTRKSEARLRYNLLGIILFLFVMTAIITFSVQLKNGAVTENNLTEQVVSAAETSLPETIYTTDAAPAATTIDKFIAYFNANADLFVLAWAIFFLVHCLKLFTGLAGIQRLRHYKTQSSPGEWQVKLDHLSQLLGIKQSVILLQSELVKVPVAIGLFKPVILIPLGLLSHLPPEQVETILLHELGHIRRKDYLVNILQRFAEAVFFFNPALLWISSLTRQEREACCDDIVVANTTHKGSYLEALVSFQEYSFTARGYAMAISSKRHYLLNRVKRMITRENKKLNIMEKILLLISMIAVTAFTFISKNETIPKTDITVIDPVKEQVEPKLSLPASLPAAPVTVRKPVVKKENKKAVLQVSVEVPPVDTIPPPTSKKEKDISSYDNLKFPSASSTVNNDGKTKTETTTVTDQDGKKYTFTKLNNKVTSLSIDGKNIPENELNNYSQLFDRIENEMRGNRAMRLKIIEAKKADMAERKELIKDRTAEINQQREMQTKQRRSLFEQNKRALQERRKAFEKERKTEKRLFEKLRKQKVNVPTINGREVIKNDIPVENSATSNETTKADFNIKSEMSLLNGFQNNTTKKIEFKKNNKFDLAKKSNLKIDMNKDLLKSFEYKTGDDEWNLKAEDEPTTDKIKPNVPGKPASPAIKPSKTAPPVKFRKSTELFRIRVTT